MSLDGIINDSKEYYLKDDKEKNLLYYLIDEALKEKYHLKITDKEKLIVVINNLYQRLIYNFGESKLENSATYHKPYNIETGES